MPASEDEQTQDRATIVLGSILSVPLFLLAFGIVTVVFYNLSIFMAARYAGDLAPIFDLGFALSASGAGVLAGRWICDKALKSWSGWPIFVLLIAATVANALSIALGYGNSVWENTLSMAIVIVATVAAWFLIVKKIELR